MVTALEPNEITAILKLVSKIQLTSANISSDSLNGISIDEKDLNNIIKCCNRLSHSITALLNR